MISLTLFGLAVLWIVFLLRYPGLFARERRRSPSTPHYHYFVCGSDELPTWKRKVPASPDQATRPR
jgi:hypothetical protein